MATRHLRVVGLGDSTTAGTPGFLSPLEAPPEGKGNPESQYAYWMMKAHPLWNVLNRGINGQRSDEILLRLQRDVLLEKPDYVIILAGVNDIYQGAPLESIERNLLEMYEHTVKVKIIPVAATVLPYNTASKSESSKIQELNNWIRNTAKSIGIPFCDTNGAVADPNHPDRLQASPDDLHPDVSGYQSMAVRLTGVIERHTLSRQNGIHSVALHDGGKSRKEHSQTGEQYAGTCSFGFTVENIQMTFETLKSKGVVFVMPPTQREGEGIKLAVCLDPDGLPISFAENVQKPI